MFDMNPKPHLLLLRITHAPNPKACKTSLHMSSTQMLAAAVHGAHAGKQRHGTTAMPHTERQKEGWKEQQTHSNPHEGTLPE
jgi:hypothetical protein